MTFSISVTVDFLSHSTKINAVLQKTTILHPILRLLLQIASQKAAVFTEGVRYFLQSLPANSGVKPWNNGVQTVFRRALEPRRQLPVVPEANFCQQ
jgi:hypothetical protein